VSLGSYVEIVGQLRIHCQRVWFRPWRKSTTPHPCLSFVAALVYPLASDDIQNLGLSGKEGHGCGRAHTGRKGYCLPIIASVDGAV
jgi:hypothetical protein